MACLADSQEVELMVAASASSLVFLLGVAAHKRHEVLQTRCACPFFAVAVILHQAWI